MAKCTHCQLYDGSISGLIKGRGNTSHPKIIIIGEAPTKSDDTNNQVFTGKNRDLLSSILGDKMDEVYFTNLVKCCPYLDVVTKDATRAATLDEISACRRYLDAEINMIAGDDTIIMPLGNVVLNALIPDSGGISKELGKRRSITIGGRTLTVIPNYHPGAIHRQHTLRSDFARVFERIFSGSSKDYSDDIPYKILTPSEAIEKAGELLNLYNTGVIDSMIFDTETNSLNPINGSVCMMSFAHEADEVAYSIPLDVCNDMPDTHIDKFGHYQDFPTVSLQDRMKIIMAWTPVIETIPLIGHNLKFDIKFLHTNRIADLNKVTVKDDTYLLHYITFGRTFGNSLSLKHLCKKLFSINVDWDVEIQEYLSLFKRVEQRLYSNIKTTLLGKYACYDAYFNKLLWRELQQKRIKGQEQIYNLLIRATTVFADIEVSGCSVDLSLLDTLSTQYENLKRNIVNKILDLPTVKLFKNKAIAEEEENNKRRRNKWDLNRILESRVSLSSPIIKGKILYDKEYYGLPVLLKTDKGAPSSGTDAIERILEDSKSRGFSSEVVEFCKLMLSWININTIISKYTSKIPLEVIDGLYYTDFNLAGTVTGRLSSGFHTIPSRSDIKKIFNSRWASTGGMLMPADYSQLELRVMAGRANEGKWIEAYKKGIDLHLNTAAEVVFKKPHDQVTKSERKIGKVLNFGVVYGRGPGSVAGDLDITINEAKAYLSKFFADLTSLTKWMDEQKRFAVDHGFIVTPFNRIIPIPEVYSNDPKIYEHGMRAAVNYSVQSPASDIGLNAIVKMWEQFKEKNLKSKIIGMVHDSILVDVYPTELKEVTRVMKYCGETYVTDLSKEWMHNCPIVLDISLGYSWGYAIEGDISVDDNDTLVFEGEDLEKSWRILKMLLEKNYDIKEEVLHETELPEDYFSMENVVRSAKKLEERMIIT